MSIIINDYIILKGNQYHYVIYCNYSVMTAATQAVTSTPGLPPRRELTPSRSSLPVTGPSSARPMTPSLDDVIEKQRRLVADDVMIKRIAGVDDVRGPLPHVAHAQRNDLTAAEVGRLL